MSTETLVVASTGLVTEQVNSLLKVIRGILMEVEGIYEMTTTMRPGLGSYTVSFLSKDYDEREDGATELMLRVSKRELVIARIALRNRRAGGGTRLLCALNAFAAAAWIPVIRVESTCTVEISKWCEKLRFTPINRTGYTDNSGIFWGDWERVVDEHVALTGMIKFVDEHLELLRKFRALYLRYDN